MADSNNSFNTLDTNRWECKFCHKTYSHNYPFKKHLQKCLVHTAKAELENAVLIDLKAELKEQFTHMFQKALNDMTADMRASFHNVQPLRRVVSTF